VAWELVEFAEVCKEAESVASVVACKGPALVAVSVVVLRLVEHMMDPDFLGNTFEVLALLAASILYLVDCCHNQQGT